MKETLNSIHVNAFLNIPLNIGYIIRGYIDRGKFVVNFGYSFDNHFVLPVGGEGMGLRGWMKGAVTLASCEYHFVRVHENLV